MSTSKQENYVEKSACPSPHSLLTRHVLEQSLKNDLGPRWTLVTYEIKDFTKKGDNYQCFITGISCEARSNDEEKKTFYVAKLNPLNGSALRLELLEESFMRETNFLSKVSFKINEILKSLNRVPVIFPETVYFDLSLGREVMITRDLRQQGFRMVDKTVGLGIEHCTLVFKGLARLHASSIVLKNQLGSNQIPDIYPCLFDKFLQPDSQSFKLYNPMMSEVMNVVIKVAESIEGYEKAKTWIQNIKDTSFFMYGDQVKKCPPNMQVICQGDCWYNNLLFRYNSDGVPEDVAFLDLQYPRYASLGLDLNNFLYSSVDGDLRKKNYHQFLSIYFNEFESVIKEAKLTLPFTEEEFKKEVHEKTVFGMVIGFLIFPLALDDDASALNFSEIQIDTIDNHLENYVQETCKKVTLNPFLKPKLEALLDDISEKILGEE